jgi:hypothetical protein
MINVRLQQRHITHTRGLLAYYGVDRQAKLKRRHLGCGAPAGGGGLLLTWALVLRVLSASG